jgi:hypothetical protein
MEEGDERYVVDKNFSGYIDKAKLEGLLQKIFGREIEVIVYSLQHIFEL